MLSASGSETVFAEILGATDRPSTPSADVEWEPYVSGFPQGVLLPARTFPTAVSYGGRAGFVFTHVLVLPASAAQSVENLSAITNNLLVRPELPDSSPQPIELSSTAFTPPPLCLPDHRVNDATRKLLDNPESLRPVVWIGQEDFENAINRIWAGMLPAMRAVFQFRLSFERADSEKRGLTIVASPIRSVARWTGFSVVDVTDRHSMTTPAERLLAWESDELKHAIDRLGFRSGSLSDLRIVEEVEERLPIDGPRSYEDATRLLRLLVAVAPTRDDGMAQKSAAIESLVGTLSRANSNQIHALRNIDPAAFHDGLSRLQKDVARWVRENFRENAAISPLGLLMTNMALTLGGEALSRKE